MWATKRARMGTITWRATLKLRGRAIVYFGITYHTGEIFGSDTHHSLLPSGTCTVKYAAQCVMVTWPDIEGHLNIIQRSISLLAKIFSELAPGCARLYNCNKTKKVASVTSHVQILTSLILWCTKSFCKCYKCIQVGKHNMLLDVGMIRIIPF